MKPVPIHLATIEQGVLRWKDLVRLKKWISGLRGEVEVIIQKKQKQRTNKQNRYYRAYLHIIEEDCGIDQDFLHEVFKGKFLPVRFGKIFGEEVTVSGSTKPLNTIEFSEYIMKIESFTGIPAPDPNEIY